MSPRRTRALILLAIALVALAAAGCGGGGGTTTVTEVTTTQVEDTTGGAGTINDDPGKHVGPDTTTPAQGPDQPNPPDQSGLPANAVSCTPFIYVGPKTSCPFAREVADKWKSSGDTVIEAHSSVTGITYTMTCTGSEPVTCRGGNNAVVYLDP